MNDCDIVFVPSLWSASIEGALIKSLNYANLVVTVKTEMGYESEISGVSTHLRVSSDVSTAASEIKFMLNRGCVTDLNRTNPIDYYNFSSTNVLEKLQMVLKKY